jgi:hypothetical protein
MDLVTCPKGMRGWVNKVCGATLLEKFDQPSGQSTWPAIDISDNTRNSMRASYLRPIWLAYVKFNKNIARKHRLHKEFWAFVSSLCLPNLGTKRVKSLPLQINHRQSVAIWP